jgi:hypothetical protein
MDLKQDDFQILKRNERQTITSFRHEDDPSASDSSSITAGACATGGSASTAPYWRSSAGNPEDEHLS